MDSNLRPIICFLSKYWLLYSVDKSAKHISASLTKKFSRITLAKNSPIYSYSDYRWAGASQNVGHNTNNSL